MSGRLRRSQEGEKVNQDCQMLQETNQPHNFLTIKECGSTQSHVGELQSAQSGLVTAIRLPFGFHEKPPFPTHRPPFSSPFHVEYNSPHINVLQLASHVSSFQLLTVAMETFT